MDALPFLIKSRRQAWALKRSAVIFLALAMCWQSRLCAQTASPANPSQEPVRVPFVGCASGGQQGPLKAPRKPSKLAAISPELAQRLAYYQAENGTGVLAPRGWHCIGTYGSNGDNLYITPEPINSSLLFSAGWKGFTGAAIQAADSYGGTSGRFEVARVIARVFPSHMKFAKDVIAEGEEPASSFPQGPYPTDKLNYLSKEVVEYETPANQEGLGTMSRLQRNGSPITGVAILDSKEQILFHLSLRLPSDSIDLGPAIIRQLEKDEM
jgi:hypothetical protein